MRQYLLLFLMFSLIACADEEPIPSTPGEINDPNTWLVPQDQVFDGGPGKDGIPSIDDPNFSSPEEMAGLITDDVLVLGIVQNGKARAYPHPILDWHEIVNDDFEGLSVAITYCPLTGTGIGWNRVVDNGTTEFGVSGLLYDSNLMPYDRTTNSTWSQQRLECVNGINVGKTPDLVTLIETEYSTWLEAYPDTEILNSDTGFNRSYGQYPYGDYKTNDDRLLFAVSNVDNRLGSKERVLGVLMENAQKAYRFGDGNETELINDVVDNQKILVVRNKAKNYIIAFDNSEDLTFDVADSGSAGIFKDSNGNVYDLAGQIISGSGQGGKLSQVNSFIGFWFSWGTFYPDIELYEE